MGHVDVLTKIEDYGGSASIVGVLVESFQISLKYLECNNFTEANR